MRSRSLYDVLGVSRSASPDEIKTAFRRHARDHHPDATGGSADAEERFKEISRAYAILGSARDRSRYDRGDIDESGATATAPGNRENDRRGSPRDQTKSRSKPAIKIAGADVAYTLKVGFLESVNGTKKTIGTTNGKRLNVSIPPGTRDGQVLRLKGQGMPGLGGGRDGDALVEVLIDRRDDFTVIGDDVQIDLPISLKEAIVGAKVMSPSIDGVVAVRIPSNSNSGDVLRLRGKGMERAEGGRGDQLVRLIIHLPNKPDAALNAFIRDWSPNEAFDARADSHEKQD